MISYWLHLCCPPVGKPLSAKVDEFRKISEGGRGVICDLKIFIAKYCIRNSCFCQSENREDECRGWLANEAFCLGVCVSGQQLADSFSWISAAAASGRHPNPALNLLHFFTSFLSLTSWREIQVLKHPKKGFFHKDFIFKHYWSSHNFCGDKLICRQMWWCSQYIFTRLQNWLMAFGKKINSYLALFESQGVPSFNRGPSVPQGS